MKIVLTGSLGNISKPLTKLLVEEGHQVTLISTDADKIPQIQEMGAQPAIGKLQDMQFLVQTFKGADVVYCMNPLDFTAQDLNAWAGFTDLYIQAIRETGVKRAIVLTGWIGHLLKDVQPEKKWEDLQDVAITIMRPGVFYSNFYSLTPMIRQQQMIAANYGDDDMVAFVAPADIAAAIAEEINTPAAPGIKIRYAASEELTCSEAAQIIGEAIGKPDLQWITIPGEQFKEHLEAAGITTVYANLLVEMQDNIHNGNAQRDYYLNRPVLGKTKLRDFATEFAAWYHQN